MEYRYMGRTGLQLSVLSFGSWVSFHKQIDDKIADELMGIAYDNGINFFDNAEVYALGQSEEMMGRVLKKKNWDRSSYVVSSKAFWGWRGTENKPNQTGLSRKHLTEACNEALQRLQLDYLDLYFCHRPDKKVPIEEVVWTMHQLIQQGKVLYWGTSEWSGVEIMEAHRVAQQYGLIGPTVEQPQYNLFERQKLENEFLMIFNTVGMGTTIWSPLASGLLSGKYNDGIPEGSRFALEGFDWLKDRWIKDGTVDKVKQLAVLAKELGVSLAELSIAWCISNENVTTAILGASRKEQLLQNLGALGVKEKLTSDVKERIDQIVQTKPVLPEY
ncbi:MAG: alcohol dehydrogenase [Sphingobacteriales bacterium SCN 48-20]|jgi:voltage-dependent potassium channel beta subunit|uniref:potassium channel beta subunit family protein n=1 Tax=Terrimonas ferruginea TaxID=249 RepID=UPI00086D5433|nr:aldo/keto reductase [Terrimonas ferruginea]MBN8783412.1 aldo/keto reductase [Terrimonas ferruginea]ODT95038.1 MAG: alcohol dehydrogenase [Sphingobacteriales bacterium SCN 48-20]OJW40186.1 MAG: alcohol dehydrogenase [Sphingobacteriales bacterium 48-107]